MKAIIEIPKGSTYKYEYNKDQDQLVLDRIISIPYPENYGFIPNTLSEDSDPLDIFVIGEHPIHPMTLVSVDIVGVIYMTDNGFNDEKIIAVIKDDSLYSHYISTMSASNFIDDFLVRYKKGIIIKEFGDKDQALKTIEEARDRYYAGFPTSII